MNWMECFETYKYRSIYTTHNNAKQDIDLDFFIEDDNVLPELREIYISESGDELFLVLQPDMEADIHAFCEEWDSRILNFLNFGNRTIGFERSKIERMRYNIIQMVLVGNGTKNKLGKEYMRTPSDLEEQKSTSISRKVFIECAENDELDIENKIQLPFWYDEFDNENNENDLEDQLDKLLSGLDKVNILFQVHSKPDRRKSDGEKNVFTSAEFDEIKGWLTK